MSSYFSSVTGRVPTKYTIVKGNLYTIDDWMTRNKITNSHTRALNELISEGYLTDADWKHLDNEGRHSERVLTEIYKRSGVTFKPRAELIKERAEAELKARTQKAKAEANPKRKAPVEVLDDEDVKDDKPVKMKKVDGNWVPAE